MRNLKKWISLALALIMCVGAASAVAETVYTEAPMLTEAGTYGAVADPPGNGAGRAASCLAEEKEEIIRFAPSLKCALVTHINCSLGAQSAQCIMLNAKCKIEVFPSEII